MSEATPAAAGAAQVQLDGLVALVTGASRGVGRGVALELGRAGATVYVTGRSTEHGSTESLPGTVAETAARVTAAGGRGIAVPCDHHVDGEVAALFDRIDEESGRLDLLVNNAWSGYERAPEAKFDAPFWKQPTWRWDSFAASLRGYYLAASLAAPRMIDQGRGLVVTITYTDGDKYLGQAAYDVAKHATSRLAFALAQELARYDVTSLALCPGFVRTERVEAAAEAMGEGPASVLHSPEYVGRAVAHLVADPDVGAVSGRCLAVGDVARTYDFTDIDGRQPPAFTLEGNLTLATRMERLNRLTRTVEARSLARA